MGMALSILREKNPDATMDAFTIAFDDKVLKFQPYQTQTKAPWQRSAKHTNAKFNVFHAKQEMMTDAFEDAFLLSKYVRDAGYKVVLTGEGSDEHFAGYEFFNRHSERAHDAPHALGGVSQAKLARRDEAHRVKVSQANQPSLDKLWKAVVTHQQHHAIQNHNPSPHEPPNDGGQIAVVESWRSVSAEFDRHRATESKDQVASAPHRALHRNKNSSAKYLSNHVGDRSEMAHSIEGRVPFLDYRLTTYVNSLPPQVKVPSTKPRELSPRSGSYAKPSSHSFPTKSTNGQDTFMAPPSEFDPEAYHWKKIKSRVTQQAVEKLGWMDWTFVDSLMTRFMTTNDKFAQTWLNFVMSFIVIQERFGVATWTPPSLSIHETP
ncbi:hypothetical protein AeRB84_005460 [Aphanomyces euteiches]|nr:hypothetical protein AeRB84_005460 [Aphanomyces euteiches]